MPVGFFWVEEGDAWVGLRMGEGKFGSSSFLKLRREALECSFRASPGWQHLFPSAPRTGMFSSPVRCTGWVRSSWGVRQPARGLCPNSEKSQITGSNRPASSKKSLGGGGGRGRGLAESDLRPPSESGFGTWAIMLWPGLSGQ